LLKAVRSPVRSPIRSQFEDNVELIVSHFSAALGDIRPDQNRATAGLARQAVEFLTREF
jgi:hypothetical protein